MNPNKDKPMTGKINNVPKILRLRKDFIEDKLSIQQICNKYHLTLSEALATLNKSYEYQEVIDKEKER